MRLGPSRRAVIAALAALPVAARAQPAWPSRPVAVVMPLQAGSASDVAARIVAERLGEVLGQRFVVENVTGAAGLIGAERAARATPDGHALAALNNSILTILPNVLANRASDSDLPADRPSDHRTPRRRVGFDPFADFAPIGGIATIPTFLGVHRDVPVEDVPGLIRLARERAAGQELTYASGGGGSPQHLATEMFMAMGRLRMTEVAYRGAGQAATDLAAGHVQVMFISHTLTLPFRDSGRIRFIGFAGAERHPDFPALPTVAEQGVPGFEYSSWIGLFAPQATPAEILARLRAECAAALGDEGLRERLVRSGLAPWYRAAEALTAVMREDDQRWKDVVRTADIRI
jgi:tripartite-type tricarboxylate transporter receptor subunit TctC